MLPAMTKQCQRLWSRLLFLTKKGTPQVYPRPPRISRVMAWWGRRAESSGRQDMADQPIARYIVRENCDGEERSEERSDE